MSQDLTKKGSRKNSILRDGWKRGDGGDDFDAVGEQREDQNIWSGGSKAGWWQPKETLAPVFWKCCLCKGLKLRTLIFLPEILRNQQLHPEKEKAVKGPAISFGGLFSNTFLRLYAEVEDVLIWFILMELGNESL